MGQFNSHTNTLIKCQDTNEKKQEPEKTYQWEWCGTNNCNSCNEYINNLLNYDVLVGEHKTVIIDNKSYIFTKLDEKTAIQKDVKTNIIRQIRRKTNDHTLIHNIKQSQNSIHSYKKVKLKYLYLLSGYIRDIYYELLGNKIIPIDIMKLCTLYFIKTQKQIAANHRQFGLKYFYWDYYKNNISTQDPTDKFYGTTRCVKHENQILGDFYVPKKYGNLKIELCENTIYHISLERWNSLMTRAKLLVNCKTAKDLFCPRRDSARYYDMEFGEIMSVRHIISMMAIHNYDRLYTRFNETFRLTYNTTNIEEMVNRHREYYWLARLVRECVECFGMK
eukprot:37408_1